MFLQRLEKVKSELRKKGLEGVLISSPVAVTYLTGYSGFTDERDVFLLITKNNNFLLTHSIYSNVISVEGFEIVEISRRLPPQKAILKLLKKKTARFDREARRAKLGIEENDLKVNEYKKFIEIFGNLKNFEIKSHRTIKNQSEIDMIEKACKISDEAYEYILKQVKEGISEKELAFKLEYFIKQQGTDLSFPTIAAFGVNSFAPHHQTGNKKLEKGEFVLLDFGVKWQNYCSDMTRTIVFGVSSKEQKKIYETVLEAQKRAISAARAGVKVSDVDRAAREYIKLQGYPDIPHSVGHGIGLEVHEHPYISKKSKEVLKNGMVFSIEPGIYLAKLGGVRIEDLFSLEDNKLRRLTKSKHGLS